MKTNRTSSRRSNAVAEYIFKTPPNLFPIEISQQVDQNQSGFSFDYRLIHLSIIRI